MWDIAAHQKARHALIDIAYSLLALTKSAKSPHSKISPERCRAP